MNQSIHFSNAHNTTCDEVLNELYDVRAQMAQEADNDVNTLFASLKRSHIALQISQPNVKRIYLNKHTSNVFASDTKGMRGF